MKDIDKIKQLIFSNDKCNIDLGFELMKGLGYSDFLIKNWIVNQGILYTEDTTLPDGLDYYGPYYTFGKLANDINLDYILVPVTLKDLPGENVKFKTGIHDTILNHKGVLINVTLFVKEYKKWSRDNCIAIYSKDTDPEEYKDVMNDFQDYLKLNKIGIWKNLRK